MLNPEFDDLTERPDFDAALKSLSRLAHIILLALIVLGASVCFYLRIQVGLVRRQLGESGQFVGEYRKTMGDLRTRAEAFAKANPDFQPVFRKYFASTNPPPSSAGSPIPASERK